MSQHFKLIILYRGTTDDKRSYVEQEERREPTQTQAAMACIKFVGTVTISSVAVINLLSVVGASGCGKTCLISRDVDSNYLPDTPSTIGGMFNTMPRIRLLTNLLANYVPKQINLFGTKVKVNNTIMILEM